MAGYGFKDATFTFNSQVLTAYVEDISGVKLNAMLQDFHPMGAVFPTPLDTGNRNHDAITVTFKYDGGGAATPPTACAVGTSSPGRRPCGRSRTSSSRGPRPGASPRRE